VAAVAAVKRLEDLSAAELERRFPPRRPAPRPVPRATEPKPIPAPWLTASGPPVVRRRPAAKPAAKPVAKPVAKPAAEPRPPALEIDGRRCQSCRRPWAETSGTGSTGCPFCGAER
jgi:hypothetical protein